MINYTDFGFFFFLHDFSFCIKWVSGTLFFFYQTEVVGLTSLTALSLFFVSVFILFCPSDHLFLVLIYASHFL